MMPATGLEGQPAGELTALGYRRVHQALQQYDLHNKAAGKDRAIEELKRNDKPCLDSLLCLRLLMSRALHTPDTSTLRPTAPVNEWRPGAVLTLPGRGPLRD